MPYKNPTLTQLAKESGGGYLIGNAASPALVSQYACEHDIDLAIVNNDASLAAGVVDALSQRSIAAYGPNRSAARIEWSKSWARELVSKVNPSFNPRFRVAHSSDEVLQILKDFGSTHFVVKPDGLTGGKGVQVLGKHLRSAEDALMYARSLLTGAKRHRAVVFEELLLGHEFTIMGFTDGKVIVPGPCTFDYPYRKEGDAGPGTGGMGSCSDTDGRLPFLSSADVRKCVDLMSAMLPHLNASGSRYVGILNGGFFKCANGDLKVMEFNARMGDPECMNVLPLMDTSFLDVALSSVHGKLDASNCTFRRRASICVYAVAPSYPNPGRPVEFQVDTSKLSENGIQTYFGSCEWVSRNVFRSIGSSRLAAFAVNDSSLIKCQERIYGALKKSIGDNIDWRRDIGVDLVDLKSPAISALG
jgi:phosphoribosylamine--glycine ligase